MRKNILLLLLIVTLSGCSGRQVVADSYRQTVTYQKSIDSEKPVVVYRVAPKFPRHAALQMTSGWVVIQFTVAKDGGVKDAIVLKSEPNGVFDKAAMDAFVKWKFKPQVVGGVAVEVPNQKVTIDFVGNDY